MKLQKKIWGTSSKGDTVYRYTLSNEAGMSVDLCNIGCSILSILVPDRDGNLVDVALGYENITDYETNGANFGCIVGRYGNRIGKSAFTFLGKEYHVEANEGRNHLHGASGGYAYRYWECVEESDERLTFRLESPDGDGGYPGDLVSLVSYSLSEDNGLTISYHITTETAAFCNLTNHNYFNLSGHKSGSILDHEVTLAADAITEIDPESIPTGVILPIAGTALDFNTPKTIGQDIESDMEQIKLAGGYDHNYVLKEGVEVNVTVSSAKTGITMEVITNNPGVQFYTGNFLNGIAGKDGALYQKRSGFCLETQLFPDSINRPEFPSCMVTKDAPQDFQTTYRFKAN